MNLIWEFTVWAVGRIGDAVIPRSLKGPPTLQIRYKTPQEMKTDKFTSKLVAIAAAENGVEEVDGSNCGPRVNEYKAATWLDPKQAWPWCAAFVDWCVWEAMKGCDVAETATFKRPRTAGAWDLRNWSLKQDGTTQTKDKPGFDIQPGDLIGYTFSHCGIAASEVDAGGFFWCHEGNTDGEGSREGGIVLRKKRHYSKVKFRIRFSL